jgi:hypothetical protein
MLSARLAEGFGETLRGRSAAPRLVARTVARAAADARGPACTDTRPALRGTGVAVRAVAERADVPTGTD